MQASQLVKELTQIIDSVGDLKVNISCAKPDPAIENEQSRNQKYLMSEPTFVVVEDYEEEKEVSIRDWPY